MIEAKKQFMEAAIEIALKSKENGDYAIGAVIVKEDKIIANGLNRSKTDQDPTSHSEVIAIREAAKLLKSRHLDGCVLYTTHEPCPMCAAAVVWAKMKGVVFGSRTEDMAEYRMSNGSEKWSWRTIDISAAEVLAKGEPKPFLIKDFMREECKRLFHS